MRNQLSRRGSAYSPVSELPTAIRAAVPAAYLALSIIVTVLCCLPFGIVGIIKSSNVSKEYAAGNYAEAKDASKQAKTWSIIGLCCGLFWIILYIILLACGVMAGLADL